MKEFVRPASQGQLTLDRLSPSTITLTCRWHPSLDPYWASD